MKMLDRKLRRDLWAMKSQVLAIAFVMAAGLSTLVMSLGVVESLSATRTAYYENYRFADVFLDLKRAPNALQHQIEEIPGVLQAETRVIVGATLDVPGMAEPATAQLVSIPEGRQPTLNRLYLREGKLVEPFRENEVVVGDAFAEAHGLKPGDTLSAIISGHKRTLEIVGIALSPEFIYAMAPGTLFPDNKRYAILWMGRDALEAAHDMDGAFNNVTLSLMHNAAEDEVIAALDELAKPYGGLGAYGREDQISDLFVRNELTQLEAMAFVAPAIFLTVAAFLLNMVLGRMISLEREQIGTMKALGVSNAEIARHYALFALMIAVLALLIGIALGIWAGRGIAEMYTEFFRFPSLEYRFPPSVLAISILVSGGAALFGAYRSIRQVVALPPAEAMRPEPPASYKALKIEKWGLTRLLTPSGRMIWRHLERRVRRSVITMFGVSIALGMLIASSFSLDAIDFILDVQFNQAEREDIGVSLIEPSSEAAFFDIRHLPGVLQAEPYRSVPVKMKFMQRTERVALMGVDPANTMHRALDIKLEPIPIARSGVMLTEKLADDLGVQPGDEVTVEVLEGRRPTRTLIVSGITQQYIGTSALMDIAALNTLMMEGRSVSGAWLAIDGSRLNAFYEQVKETPAIAGINIRQAAITSFNETMAENIVQMTIVNILFAGLIAFGVIYNTARISVSERGRELASLRVLGFSRGEISAILLGELAILVALAIPVGWVLGYGLAALMALGFETDLFRIPLVVDSSTYAKAGLVVIVAAALSALVVRRRLDRLDLVEVLKTRE